MAPKKCKINKPNPVAQAALDQRLLWWLATRELNEKNAKRAKKSQRVPVPKA